MKTITDIIDPTIADLPETTATLATMSEHWERLVSLLPSVPTTQTADSLPPCSYGIDDEFRPIDLNYRGKVRPITWDKLHSIIQPLYPSHHSSKALREIIARNCDLSYLVEHAELVTGEEVRESFCDQWRPGSCMRKSEAADWLDIYVNNPDDVGLLRFAAPLLDTNIGMSWLVWFGKSRNYFDKTYSTNNDSVVSIIKRRLAAHFDVPCPEDRPRRFRLFWNGGTLPWMDSLSHVPDYSESKQYIVLSSSDGPCCLHDVDGWHPDRTKQECDCCGAEIDDDDSYHLDNGTYCSECVGYCELCEETCLASELMHAVVARQERIYSRYGSRTYTEWREEEVWCSEHILSSDYTESDISNVYFPDGEGIDLTSGETISPTELDHDDVYWCKDSEISCTLQYVCCTDDTPNKDHLLVEIDGEYYDIDDANVWLQFDDDGQPECFRLRTDNDPAEWSWPESPISETHAPAVTPPQDSAESHRPLSRQEEQIPPMGAAQFKPGDRVICIDAGRYDRITEGREYIVIEWDEKPHGTFLRIIENTGDIGGYYPHRFRPVPVLDNPPDMISTPRTPEPPAGHRWLELGEIIQTGDRYHAHNYYDETWETTNGGQNIAVCPVRLYKYSTTRPAPSPLSDGQPAFGWRYRQAGERIGTDDTYCWSNGDLSPTRLAGFSVNHDNCYLTTEPAPSFATT